MASSVAPVPAAMAAAIDAGTAGLGAVLTALLSAVGYVGKRYVGYLEGELATRTKERDDLQKVIGDGYAEQRALLAEALQEKLDLKVEVLSLRQRVDAAEVGPGSGRTRDV